MATATRLYVTDDLGPGMPVEARADQAHYLRNVLRFKGGEVVHLFNGRDGEWRARVDALGKGRARFVVEEKRRDQRTSPDLWLLYAPIKRARHDFLIEKAVELGVSRLLPVLTGRTQVERVKEERLQANLIEAAEQCERLDIPALEAPLALDARLDGWPSNRRLILCAEAGAAPPIGEALAAARATPDPARPAWAVLTGPEGGFSDAELETLRHLPFVLPVGLGPRILRAETAAMTALAVWQSVLGDGGMRPPDRVE
ncbi:16S rRNA (uracil(1498)-N(3))-methyltransferase [Marivibrio halodurans]|uniref:Ribosomal RNA small subunit methyltransferase E n=1 Tax=Marivibrio halodurans TaxID=2039722 RepID=A0A8J7V259_9PROT|nr:16S rRNA (uracil(1498)-N(3))-methyltransferase [Marivibrio halodurans]MBP5858496.1 16S rRNA (uracil(1498)-N(3))-methyltransferase [Marivibrio halodurans]